MTAPALRRFPVTLWLIAGALIAVAMVALAVVAVRLGPATETGRLFIAAQVSGIGVGRLGRLSIRGVHGDPWRDFSIDRLDIADRQGVWLDARGVRLRWRPGDLLGARLVIETASAQRVTLARRPILAPAHSPRRRPVAVEVRSLQARVVLLRAFAQRVGVYNVVGGGDVERGGDGFARGRALSITHPGDFARLEGQQQRGAFLVDGDALEAHGGAIAGALGLPPDRAFAVTLRAAGRPGEGRFVIGSRSGSISPVSAAGAWKGRAVQASGRLDLGASSLVSRWRRILGPEAAFTLSGAPGPDGLTHIDLTARSPNASLIVRGEADLARRAAGPGGLAVTAVLADAGGLVSSPGLGAVRLKGGLGGDTGHWVFAGGGEIDRVSVGGAYALARLQGPVRLEGRAGGVDVVAGGQGEGGAGRGLAAALLGGRPSGSVAATRLSGGRLLIRRLTLAGPGLQVTGTGSRGLFGDLAFQGQAGFSNLAAAHAGARGLVLADWHATQGGAGRPWSLSLDAKATNLATGLSELDRLLGTAPGLTAKADISSGLVAIKTSSLRGATGNVSAAGTIRGAADLALQLAWRAQGPFTLGPAEIAGAASGSGALTGTLGAPRADLVASFDHIATPLAPLEHATVRLTFARESGGAGGKVAVNGASAYGPAKGAADFRFAQGGLDLTDLAIDAGGATAKGSLRLRQSEPSLADLAFAVGPGAFLSAGHAQGRLEIAGAPGGARAKLSLIARDAALRSGAGEVSALSLEADGPLSRLPFRLSAEGSAGQGPWRVMGTGEFRQAGADRSASFAGAGRIGRIEFHTLAPAQVRFATDGASGAAELAVGQGRANVRMSQNGGEFSASAALSDVALSLLNPDLGGRLDGDVTLSGRGAVLAGAADARFSGVQGRDMKGQPPVAGEFKAELRGGRLAVDADFTDTGGMKAQADFTVPATASAAPFHIAIDRHGALRGHFSIAGEVRPVWDLFLGGDRALSGRAVAQGSLSGDLADPKAVGTADLTGGAFDDAQTGMKLRNMSLSAVLAETGVDVRQFAAADGAGGSVSGQGRISLLRDGVSSFRLELNRFRVIDNDIGQAEASGAATVSRAADGRIELTGGLTIDKGQIAPKPPVPSGVVAMEVTEIHRPAEGDSDSPVASRPPAPIALDVTLRATRGLFVKGRGLNVELALDASVKGTTAAPVLSGVARVVRGDYDFAGRRFTFDDTGVVRLGSTPSTIRLDLTATREGPSLTAVIRVQGTAARPEITLTSTPVLPTDEVLSQVLFGASASQLTALQGAQLASALAGLAGGGGFDVMGGLRTFAHLDRVAFGAGPTETTVMGGKYLSDKVYLELGGGGPEGGSAELDWRVRKHLSIVSRLTGAGGSELSIRWRKDF